MSPSSQSPSPRRVLERLARRQRMPPLARLALAGEFVVEVDVDRARQMARPGTPGGPPGGPDATARRAGGRQRRTASRSASSAGEIRSAISPMVPPPRRPRRQDRRRNSSTHETAREPRLRSTMEGCPRPPRSFATAQVQAGFRQGVAENTAVPPIYQSNAFEFSSLTEAQGAVRAAPRRQHLQPRRQPHRPRVRGAGGRARGRHRRRGSRLRSGRRRARAAGPRQAG